MKRIAMVVLIVALVITAGVTMASSSANYALRWRVIAGGGQRSTSGSYRVAGTVGQAVTGPPRSASASYRVGAGYWSRLDLATTPLGHRIYLPLIQR
jgi:hypothetical protein